MRMRFFQTRGIATRLWCGFGLILALLLLVAGVSLDRLQTYQRQADGLVSEGIGLLDAIGQVQDIAGQRAVMLRDLVMTYNPAVRRELQTRLDANTQARVDASKRLEALAAASQVNASRDSAQKIAALERELAEMEKSVHTKVTDAQFEEAKAFVGATVAPRQQDLQNALRDFTRATIAEARTSVERNRAESRVVLVFVAGLTLLAVVVGASIAFLTTRGVVQPLHAAREAALKVAQGDLSQEVNSDGNDEIAQLVGALEWMRMSLADAVNDIRTAALGVREGAQQIERGNVTLAARTEDQAASLEETASSMEELTATVQQNAHSAGEANKLARGTSTVATRGGEAVRGVVATMQGIHQSSSRIADISGVIDSIAFQTNILALNAAVEAARAGEQGRGFAVVAAEVRSLAQRSATAAKEIKALIEESTARVAGGVREVETAGHTMDEIVESVRKVNDLVAEIAHASAEQLAGIEQVNRAISQMEGNTQQNTTIVEQAAGAAEHLAQQAQVLVQTVAKFRVEGDAAERVDEPHHAPTDFPLLSGPAPLMA
jgi:methyl-accepting chemotaxis protein